MAAGLYDLSIEMDDVNNWLGKKNFIVKSEGKVNWSDPTIKQIHQESARLVPLIINALIRRGKSVVLTGVWPNDNLHTIIRGLQSYRMVVMVPFDRDEGKRRWVNRKGDLSTAERFEVLFPGASWDHNSDGMTDLAFWASMKGTLLPAGSPEYDHLWKEGQAYLPGDPKSSGGA